MPDMEPVFLLGAIFVWIFIGIQHQAVQQALVHRSICIRLPSLRISIVEHLLPHRMVAAELQPLYAAIDLRAQPPDACIPAVDGANLTIGIKQACQCAGRATGVGPQVLSPPV